MMLFVVVVVVAAAHVLVEEEESGGTREVVVGVMVVVVRATRAMRGKENLIECVVVLVAVGLFAVIVNREGWCAVD
jgi:hypothetical protein